MESEYPYKEKKSKKKFLVFFVIGFFALALVGAGIVSYLSNTVKADIEVKSPMLQEVWDGSTWITEPLSLGSVYAGESKTLYVKTKNQASVPITGMVNNFVTNTEGVACADFSSVIATTTTNGVLGLSYDLIALSLCSDVDTNTVRFSYGPTPIVWSAYQVDKTEIVVTFDLYAIGTYEFTSQVV